MDLLNDKQDQLVFSAGHPVISVYCTDEFSQKSYGMIYIPFEQAKTLLQKALAATEWECIRLRFLPVDDKLGGDWLEFYFGAEGAEFSINSPRRQRTIVKRFPLKRRYPNIPYQDVIKGFLAAMEKVAPKPAQAAQEPPAPTVEQPPAKPVEAALTPVARPLKPIAGQPPWMKPPGPLP